MYQNWEFEVFVSHLCKFTSGNIFAVWMCASAASMWLVSSYYILMLHIYMKSGDMYVNRPPLSILPARCLPHIISITNAALEGYYSTTGIQSCCSLIPLPWVPLLFNNPSSDSPSLPICREELSQCGMLGKKGEGGENSSEFSCGKCNFMFFYSVLLPLLLLRILHCIHTCRCLCKHTHIHICLYPW